MILNIGGSDVEAVPVALVHCFEPWSEFLLEDGTLFRVKLVGKRAFRLPNGNYILTSENVTDIVEGKKS